MIRFETFVTTQLAGSFIGSVDSNWISCCLKVDYFSDYCAACGIQQQKFGAKSERIK